MFFAVGVIGLPSPTRDPSFVRRKWETLVALRDQSWKQLTRVSYLPFEEVEERGVGWGSQDLSVKPEREDEISGSSVYYT